MMKEFMLEVKGIKYSTFNAVKKEGYIKGNSINGYYMDLTNVLKVSIINTMYYEISI